MVKNPLRPFFLFPHSSCCRVTREERETDHRIRFETQDALYDLAWSEQHENQVAVACGDGAIKLFDIGLDQFPVQSWQEHNREVYGINWNLVTKDTFCSSSWDGTIKVVGLPESWSHHLLV